MGRKQLDLETGKNSWRYLTKIDCHALMIVQDLKSTAFIPILIWMSGEFLKKERNPRCINESMKGDQVMGDNDVMMYTLTTCSHCKATKKFLSECGVKYEFTDVDLLSGDERAAILEDVKKFNPRCSFPTIIIGDKVIVGFKEQEIREALGL